MEAFHAIEKILQFHHTTSRQPLRISQLRLRCFQNGTQVSQKDIDTILRVWPQAYRIYTSRGDVVIEAPDLPHNVEQRRITFNKLWSEKENIMMNIPQQTMDETKTSLKRMPLKNIQKQHIQKPILMGRLKKETTNTSLNLLDRIRAKEARLKHERTPLALASNRDMFLRSQIPKLKRVLEELAGSDGSRSLEMQEIMDIMRTNLFKLGDDEIKRVLQLIIQTYPTFCSIVTVGSSTRVKLQKVPSVVC